MSDSNPLSNAMSTSTVQRSGLFGQPVSSFGGFSSTTPAPLRFGQSATSSIITSASTPGPVIQMQNSDTVSAEERFYCTSCNYSVDNPSVKGFCCGSCNKFYHRQCISISGEVRAIQLVEYFGLHICRNCHIQLLNTTPAPFSIARPLCPEPADGTERDVRSLPRRSSRDPMEIPRCESPNQVAIIAQYYAAEFAAAPMFKPSSEDILSDPDEPMEEALFEIDDPVRPFDLPQEYREHDRPSKIAARYFNSRQYLEDDSDHETSLDSMQRGIHAGNSAASKSNEDNLDDLLGKTGWFYKLDRNPVLGVGALPNMVLWHEDELELALDDDSDDEEDLDPSDEIEVEAEANEEIITEETIVERTVVEEIIVEEAIED